MRKLSRKQPAATGWEVKVCNATKQVDNYSYSRISGESIPIKGTIAVKLTFNGKVQMSYGTVMVTDSDFEDKITTLKAAAQERAAALEAVGAVP